MPSLPSLDGSFPRKETIMGTISFDGLVTGMQTGTIIDKLMALEKGPRNQLAKKKYSIDNEVKALQTLNAKFKDIFTAARGVLGKGSKFATAKPEEVWAATSAKSSDKTVTVDTRAGAVPGSLDMKVEAVAKNQVSTIEGAKLASLGERIMSQQPPSLSIVVGNRVTTISPASGSAQDMARAINSARDSGVNATAVRVGQDAEGKAIYVLQITGEKTGATDGKFELYAGDLTASAQLAGKAAEGANEDGTVTRGKTATYKAEDLQAALSAAAENKAEMDTVQQATSAKISLWNGSKIVESESNTFKNLMDKVDVTIGGRVINDDGKELPASGHKVSIDVNPDSKVATEKAEKLVEALNSAMAAINTGSAWRDGTDAEGNKIKIPGVFSTNSSVRGLNDSISNLVSGGISIEGSSGKEELVSLREFGIKLNSSKGGMSLEFDSSKFAEAMKADPRRVEKALTAFAEKVDKFATDAGDPREGRISGMIESRQRSWDRLTDQIQRQDDRLEIRRTILMKQFAAMEKAVQQAQAQGNWLAGQLASLPGFGGGQ